MQALRAAVDVFEIALITVQKDLSGGVTGAALQTDIQTLHTAFVDLVRADLRFAFDLRADQFGHGHHGHHHADQDDLFADFGGDRDDQF